MKLLSTILLIAISLLGISQSITPTLQERISTSNDNSYHRIRIEFTDNVDCFHLNHQFKKEKTTNHERAITVISKLQTQSNNSQKDLVAFLKKQHSKNVRDVQTFWIVNCVILEAKKEAIEAILEWPGVSLIDIEENTIVMTDHYKISPAIPKAIGNPEPGLVAINAPALWSMGYTGRGKMAFDFDTGVWPNHPAFKDRFIGNFYPMDQAWDGFYSETPTGEYSSHGTHTLGTMMGLDTATLDTVGVAFKAYWIANDHIRGTVAELPAISDMMASFEWALNPDGDVSTTHDIPDVINNSWRWYDDADTQYCSGTVVSLMNAIEAAGLANIFSGGNFGPNNTSVSSPQRINTSDVNTFSVGSVNANLSFPYPISSFSSIGPKQCPGSGSLSIHPEVVAPGQNVRSSYGQSGYNSISGTSMASPHVSGAILLLKEAYPMATGEDIMRALYLSATDMGVAGEDNTFGMGLIDCLSAFNHLGLTFTAVDPNAVKYDLAIQSVANPTDNLATCATSFTPNLTIENLGDSTISSIHFEYNFIGEAVQNYTWTGTLLGHTSLVVTLPVISSSVSGGNELIIKSEIDGTPQEYDVHNNRRHIRFDIVPENSLPYLETFENGFANNWRVDNPDGLSTWIVDTTAGLTVGEKSALMPFFFYSPIGGQYDELTSPTVNISGANNLMLKFERAYENGNSASKVDTLEILISTNCGNTWMDVGYKKYGADLHTIDTVNIAFFPKFSHHWVTDSIDLTGFSGSNEIQIKFRGINRKGQNLFIDNVRVYEFNDPTTLTEHSVEFKVYPNPSNGFVNVPNMFLHQTYSVYDVSGRIVKSESVNGNSIDLSNLSSGNYTLMFGDKFAKIVIQK